MPEPSDLETAKRLRQQTHGWFVTPERPGDRTLEQQLQGLDPLLAMVPGKTVLDVGAAEGLIAIECARRGAKWVYGIEIVASHVDIARRLCDELPCHFVVADANLCAPAERYDVVLLLAVLHKLENPGAACRRFAAAAASLCVIRFPARSCEAIIVDERSGNEPHDIGAATHELGFVVERIEAGPLGESTYYFRR